MAKSAWAMADGSVSSLMVSLAGLQIADALVLYITGDNRIPIRCALGRLDFDHGIVAFGDTLMDTRQSVLHFDGRADLNTQVVGTKITAEPKKVDVLDLHGPIMVQGKIRKPDISLGRPHPPFRRPTWAAPKTSIATCAFSGFGPPSKCRWTRARAART